MGGDASNASGDAAMLKCYVAPVRLRKWFPPDDTLAELVARLCVLREDLGLEMSGFHQADLGELDANSEEWRRMYFFRCFVRTMKEITHALGALAMNAEFRAILDKAAPEYQQSFKKTISEMNSAHNIVKEIRDSLGGHVLAKSMRTALAGMNFERFGFFEAGPTTGKTHYKFTGELVAEMLMTGVPENQRVAKMEHDLEKISGLLHFFALIDWIFYAYIKSRKLL